VSTDTRPWGSAQTVMALTGGVAFLLAALFGMYFFISLYLQQAGYSPLRTGLAILPAGTMTLVGSLADPG
jgi:hypothetical protein